MMDRMTNRPRGFGFVTMSTAEEAQKAIAAMNGKEIDGRALTVNVAKPREERTGGGGGGRREYGGGGGGGVVAIKPLGISGRGSASNRAPPFHLVTSSLPVSGASSSIQDRLFVQNP
jgi:RNA recognition motif-containing protein